MRYAAYGSNLHPLRLTERISSARLITTGFLPDWSMRFHKRSNDKSGKCNIFAGGDGVHLAIYEVSARDKLTLDEIEGVGRGYHKVTLSIPEVGDCASYSADHSYVDAALLPYDWYKELVLVGAGFHSFPDNYLNRIESTQALRDPDPHREVEGWKTVKMISAGSRVD